MARWPADQHRWPTGSTSQDAGLKPGTAPPVSDTIDRGRPGCSASPGRDPSRETDAYHSAVRFCAREVPSPTYWGQGRERHTGPMPTR